MISHSHKFIFIHIPKTGGSSIAYSLRHYGIQLQGKKNFDSIYFKHISTIELEKLMGDEFHNYYKFSFVRNPWDWVVSNYYFNGGLHRPFVKGSNVAQSGKQPCWVAEKGFKSWLKWWLKTLQPSQKQMITDKKGNILVNDVFKYENLYEQYLSICNKFSIIPVEPFPHLKMSQKSTSFRSHYDDETLELVYAAFSWEINTFNYSFD